MKQTAEERIYEALYTLEKNKKEGITANELANYLTIKRNSASHYLNILLEQRKIYRTNTKPARWTTKTLNPIVKNEDVFSSFVGFKTSLKSSIQQCKAAIEYPPRGLPIIVNGRSGVGKSFLASLIHEYCLKEKLINEGAPFIVLNCADYANNPELLSATLFGYKKGAFTGADEDRTGLIDEADTGILFLDEVHRLSFENQEKLFLLMDQGIYRPLGDKGQVRHASIRFIFATTEKNDQVLLDTFRRRIPVSIYLPDFHERPFEERIQLIHLFYKQEAVSLQKNITIDSEALEYLSFSKFEGNIGRLKNLIKLSCANSWLKNKEKEKLIIDLSMFPDNYSESKNEKMIYDSVEISCELTESFSLNSVMPYSRELIESLWEDIAFFESSGFNKNIFDLLKTKINKIIKQISSEVKMTSDDEMGNSLVNSFISTIEKPLQDRGLLFSRKDLEVLYWVYKYFQFIDYRQKNTIHSAYQIIKGNFSKENYIAKKLIKQLAHYNISNEIFLEIFFTFFIASRWKSKARLQGLIVTHGDSTAYSISSVVNYLCKDFVFESVDMPIDVSINEIIHNVRKFIEQIDTREGLVLLVDMGSLGEMFTQIKNSLEGELLIINNVTTMIALDIGTKLSNGLSFDKIALESAEGYVSEAKYYEGISKGDNVIVSCISGLGISEKLKDIIHARVDNQKLAVVSVDYEKLQENDKVQELLKDTRLIITTSNLMIKTDTPVLEIEKLWSPQGEELLRKGLRDSISTSEFELLKQDLVRFFSMEGISDRLTFLNPSIVIADVELIVSSYEDYYNMNFELFKRLNLCMHMSMMLERLITDNSSIKVPKNEYSEQELEFHRLTETIFDPLMHKYNIELSDYETHLLYQLVMS
ncbi:sigma 54-interacting transcriptional regulator [Enterococcus olivae]